MIVHGMLSVANKLVCVAVRLGYMLLWVWYHLPSAIMFLIGIGLTTLPGTFQAFNNPLGGIVLVIGIVVALIGMALWDPASKSYVETKTRRIEAKTTVVR